MNEFRATVATETTFLNTLSALTAVNPFGAFQGAHGYMQDTKDCLETTRDMSRNAHKNCKKEIMLANLGNMAKMTILQQSPTRQSTKE